MAKYNVETPEQSALHGVQYSRVHDLVKLTLEQSQREVLNVKATAGVGLVLDSTMDGTLHIIEVVPGGAAAQDGRIQRGDILLGLNGQLVIGRSAEQLRPSILGPTGTQIELSIQRGGTQFPVLLVRGGRAGGVSSQGGVGSLNRGMRSTVGILLNDTRIDQMVVGGPAHMCKVLEHGDEIIQIDGYDTPTKEAIMPLLRGSDVPGSKVDITVKRNGGVGTVTLMRMANEEIADRRQLFETFTEMKNEAMVLSDKKLAGMTDKVVDLWSKMVLAEMVHGQKIEENVKDLQAQLKDLLEEVVGELPKLKVSFEENKELAALRAQCKQQEAELATSKNLCASQEDLIKKLTEQLAASQKELSDTKEKDAKIIEDQDREIVELKRQLRDLKTDDEAKIAEIATKVAKLENDIKLGMEQLESKNAEIDTLKKNVSDLEDELTKLRQQLAVLKEEMDNLTKELASLQEARDKLAKQGKVAGDLEAELKKLREQLTALKEERDKLAKAAAMLKDAQDEIERLKKLLADMEAAMKVLEGQEKMSKKAVDFDLERAIQLTTLCKELVAKEHWVAHEQVQEHTEHTAAPIKNRTTVGIAFDDKSCVITNVLVGGPAFNSNKVFKGDKIVSVDSVPVVGGDIIPRLEGSDDPGSVVMIGLQRKDSNIVEELKLRRMDNKQIADKRQLFELFTKLLDKAIKKCDKESEVYTTEALDLWTAEMLEQYTHDEVCLDHFHNMQSATGSWLDELLQMLTGSAPAASAPGTSVQSGVLVRPWTFRRRS